MLNKVILTGRLTKAIEIKKTPTGKSVASFSLAVDRRQKTTAAERLTDFHDCVIWNTPAENLATWTDKGSLIGVVGRLEKRQYTNQHGLTINLTEIIVEDFTLLEYKKKSTETPASEPEQTSFFQGQSTTFFEER